MKTLSTAVGLLMALLFVLALPCAVWTFAASQTALDPNTYKAALASEDIYGELLPALIPALVEANDLADEEISAELTEEEHSQRGILLAIVGNMDEQDWRAITAELIPPERLRAQVEGGLDAFFAWLNSKGPITDIQIDLTFLKEQLSGEAGQRTVNRIMATWPACTDPQLAMLDALGDLTQVSTEDFPFCQPPGDYIATTSAVLSATLANFSSQLPDAFPDPAGVNTPQYRHEAEELRRGIELARALVIELVLVPLALLALTVFFTVRSLKGFGRWGGWMLIIGGILAVVPVLLIFPILIPGLVGSASFGPPDLPGPPQSPRLSYLGFILQEVTLSFLGAFTLPILIQSAVIIGTGFVLLVISVALRSNEEVIADQLSLATAGGLYAAYATGVTPATPSTGTTGPTRPVSAAQPRPPFDADPPPSE